MGIFADWLREKVGGGILTGDEIDRQVKKGHITISNYTKQSLNPNSYNLCCGDTVKVYKEITLVDLKDKSSYANTIEYDIDPVKGFILRPGMLYLIPTEELIHTDYYEPLITGRSSIGRLGISVHQEAGFGDIGFGGRWTLQIKVTYPTIIYPYMSIAQVYFLTPNGKIKTLYEGRYQGSAGAVSSKLGG